MEIDNVIQLNNKKKCPLPTNMKRFNSIETMRIPIFDRIYQIDGELYYQIIGDRVSRKLKDYKLKDFN